jgi:hypothetical protein
VRRLCSAAVPISFTFPISTQSVHPVPPLNLEFAKVVHMQVAYMECCTCPAAFLASFCSKPWRSGPSDPNKFFACRPVDHFHLHFTFQVDREPQNAKAASQLYLLPISATHPAPGSVNLPASRAWAYHRESLTAPPLMQLEPGRCAAKYLPSSLQFCSVPRRISCARPFQASDQQRQAHSHADQPWLFQAILHAMICPR